MRPIISQMRRRESETTELLSKGESKFYLEFWSRIQMKRLLVGCWKSVKPRYPVWRGKVWRCARCRKWLLFWYCCVTQRHKISRGSVDWLSSAGWHLPGVSHAIGVREQQRLSGLLIQDGGGLQAHGESAAQVCGVPASGFSVSLGLLTAATSF